MVIPEVPFSQLTNLAMVIKERACVSPHRYIFIQACVYVYVCLDLPSLLSKSFSNTYTMIFSLASCFNSLVGIGVHSSPSLLYTIVCSFFVQEEKVFTILDICYKVVNSDI